jgi:hypothetical protein
MFASWLLLLYPRAWRERYEAEMVAVLEQHHITLKTLGDLLLGALDAHLLSASRPRSILEVRLLLQATHRTVFWAFPLFFLGFSSFVADRLDMASRASHVQVPLVVWGYRMASMSGNAALGVILVTGIIIGLALLRDKTVAKVHGWHKPLRCFFLLTSLACPLLGMAFALHVGVPLFDLWPFFGLFLLPTTLALALTIQEMSEQMGRWLLIPVTFVTLMMATHVLLLALLPTSTGVFTGSSLWSLPFVVGVLLMTGAALRALHVVLHSLFVLLHADRGA